MKTMIIAGLMTLSAVVAADVNVYGDSYRFANPNHTGVLGVSVKSYNIEYGFYNQELSIGKRHYLAFTNIELGVQSVLTNAVQDGAADWRVTDIEGGYHYIAKPYITVGDKLFATVLIDETNSAVLRVGFELW